jgi:ATP-binding cassette subfamily B protein/subfamily B ATP-binding cassette protein MsbA
MNRWWLQFARYALPQARGLALILVLLLIGAGLGLLTPWPLKLIVDNVLTGEPLPPAVGWIATLPGAGTPAGLLAWLAGATVAVFLTNRVVAVTRSYLEAGVGSRITYALATELFDRIQRFSLRFHHKQRTGDLVKRITSDTGCVRSLVMNVFVPALTALVTLVGMFLIMWQLSRGLALFALALCLPLAWIVKRFVRPMADRRYREQHLQGEIYSLSEQMLSSIPIVQAFGREGCENTRFRRLAGETVQAQLRAELSGHQFHVSAGAVTAAGSAAVMAFGGFWVLHGGLSVGTLLVFVSYFAALYSPIETLVYLSEGLSHAGAGARRVLELFTADVDAIHEHPKPPPLYSGTKPRGMSVRFENVTFGFEPDRPVLHNVSLDIEPGQTIAIMGPTGAGKSTLVSLIPRFFDPCQGAIYVNGINIRHVSLSSLRDCIAFVPQEPFLLPISAAENIAYGRPGASRPEIIAAAKSAGANDFIEQLPSAYDTVLGDRGVSLSAGERQCISLARAFLKNAPVLIVDEPTSSVDPNTEEGIFTAINRLTTGRTTLIIAHRRSITRHCHLTFCMRGGRLSRLLLSDSSTSIAAGNQCELLTSEL